MTVTHQETKAFWHKPAGTKQYHLYNQRGQSACEEWLMIGFGLPKDTRRRTPKTACQKCVKKATDAR